MVNIPVLFFPDEHPHFHSIYSIAYHDAIINDKSLENYNKTRPKDRKSDEGRKHIELTSLLKREDRKNSKILQDPPNSYFVGLDNIKDLIQTHGTTPFDLLDEENIIHKDEEFTIFANKYFLPKFNTIEDDDDN
jgi:hypothetical protein